MKTVIARVKGSNPETFIEITGDVGVIKHTSAGVTEQELRELLKKDGKKDFEIEEIIAWAREHEA